MILGFTLIIILGIPVYYLFQKINLPGLLALLFLGIIIGPYGLNLLDQNLLSVSGELRKLALIVILLRAGLGLGKAELRAIGPTAFKLSIIPGLLEGAAIIAFATYYLGFSFAEAGILAFIIAAVSPAVIVPQMLKLKAKGFGRKKSIPTLILAGASVDDIVAITLFTAFLGLYFGQGKSLIGQILGIPISIILGVVLGLLFAFLLLKLLQKLSFSPARETLLVFAAAMLLLSLEHLVKDYISFSAYLGIMAIGYYFLEKDALRAKQLSLAFNKIWVFAELCLFVLIGAAVNIQVAINAGVMGIGLIVIGLLARSLGVYLSLIGSKLNGKEKLFTIIAYLPKATVQAAIGAIPFSMGTEHGAYILALAVTAIVITAPLGAFLIDISHSKLLEEDKELASA